MPVPRRFAKVPAGALRHGMRRIALYGPARQMAIAFAMLAAAAPAAAQSLDDTTVDSIVGSGVEQEEATAAAARDRLLAAIDNTAEATSRVRKTSNLDTVDIVFLADSARAEGGPPPEIAGKIEEHRDEIAALRQEVEANALLFHALDSRRVLVNDVLAVAFEGPRKVIVYAAAKPAG